MNPQRLRLGLQERHDVVEGEAGPQNGTKISVALEELPALGAVVEAEGAQLPGHVEGGPCGAQPKARTGAQHETGAAETCGEESSEACEDGLVFAKEEGCRLDADELVI